MPPVRGLASAAIVAVAALATVASASRPAPGPDGGQRPRSVEGAEKAQELIESAIDALGGAKYLAVTSEVGEGTFTAFQQGRRGVPVEFSDTFVYPDKDRTEFGKKKERVVQANAGDHGWKFDGARQTIEVQSEGEIALFGKFVRAEVDNVLRRFWREPGVTLEALGREEIEPRNVGEGVVVNYADGFRVELFFDPHTHLPIASRYTEGSESGAPGSTLENRYYFYLDFGGIKTPRVVDLYRDGAQTARIVYDSVRFNVTVDPAFFEQPANAKALK